MNNISFVGEHPRTYSVHPHAHDHWELVYCTGGSGSCDACDMCSGLICADCCCECMGGDLISCC